MNNETNFPINRKHSEYFSDKDLAKLVSMSPSWVRKQRMLRNRGENHSLTVDPIYIGNSPRYLIAEIRNWLEGLSVED